MPKWKGRKRRPKWVSEKYLTGVLTELYDSIKQSEIKNPVGLVKSALKAEIIRYLQGSVNRDLGFQKGNEPGTRWLVKVLYSANPNHEIFLQAKDAEISKTILQE